jgi:uncharacterized membrane protein
MTRCFSFTEGHMRFIGVIHSVAYINKVKLKELMSSATKFIVLSAIVITAKTTCFDLVSQPQVEESYVNYGIIQYGN